MARTQPVSQLRFKDIRLGQKKSRRYTVSQSLYEDFLKCFGDVSPIHIDDRFAKNKGYESKVMHGAILNGFLSHFIGTCFPGKHALLHSVNTQYRAPVYLGDVLLLNSKVEHKSDATKTVLLNISWIHVASKRIIGTTKAQVGVTA